MSFLLNNYASLISIKFNWEMLNFEIVNFVQKEWVDYIAGNMVKTN